MKKGQESNNKILTAPSLNPQRCSSIPGKSEEIKKTDKEVCKNCFEDEMYTWGPPSGYTGIMMNLGGCTCIRQFGMPFPLDKDTVSGGPFLFELEELTSEQRETIENFPKLCGLLDDSQRQLPLTFLSDPKSKIIINGNPLRFLMVLQEGKTVRTWTLPAEYGPDGPNIAGKKTREWIESGIEGGWLCEPS